MSWPEVAVDEFCRTMSGSTPSRRKAERYFGGNIPWVKSGELRENLILRTEEQVTEDALNETSIKLVPRGALLVAMYGATVGRVGKLGIDATTNQAVCAVIPDPSQADLNYIFRVLVYKAKELVALGVGGAQPNISQQKIKKLKIPLPPLEEQKRIAAILDQADAIVKKRQAALDKLNTLGQSIFYDMFGDPLINPKNLPVVALDSAGELNRGVSKHRPRNHPALLGGPHPLIQTGDVANSGDFITDYHSTYSDMGLAQSKKWPKRTLCITIAANIANTSILNFEACFPDSVVGFIPSPEFEAMFVHYWFRCVREDIERLAPAVAQKNINLKILRELEIFKPSFNEQKRFASRMTDLENSKQQNVKSLDTSFKLFSSLQNDAFSGGL